MKYSKSTNGFYDITIHTEIPLDYVDITNEQWQSLLAGQALGQIITSDKNGNPVLKDRPIVEPIILTPQEKLAQAGFSVDELKSLLGI